MIDVIKDMMKMLLQMFRTMLTENTELSDEKISELVDAFINALPIMLKTQLHILIIPVYLLLHMVVHLRHPE